MIVVWLWSVAHGCCIVAVRLTIPVVRVAALLGHAVVIAAVLILIHVLVRMILIRATMSEMENCYALNLKIYQISYGGTLLYEFW